MLVKEFKVTNKETFIEYVDYLVINDLTYHFDDSPIDVGFLEAKVTDEDIAILQQNHVTLWENIDVWAIFEEDSDLYDKYVC